MIQDRSRLEWSRVLLERRHWTSISVAVVAASAWTLAVAAGVSPTSTLWWGPVLATIVSTGVWVATVRALGRIQRQLHRAEPSVWDLQFD